MSLLLRLYENFAEGTLRQAVGIADTTIYVDTAGADLLPEPTGDESFKIIIWDGQQEVVPEIVLCTERVGQALTVTRGQEGTAATEWAAGSEWKNTLTAGDLEEFVQSANGASVYADNAADSAADALVSELAALASEVAAAASASSASTSASTATTQAGIATTQAGIATTQAGIATTQAGIATTQAAAALASAAAALASEIAAAASAAALAGAISDTAYDATSWNGVTTVAPSKNAVRDKIVSMDADIASRQPGAASLTSWAGVTRASGFDTFATTPSSANLRALITDEVGTGALYFVNGALGTPASATLTNGTGLPPGGIDAAAQYNILMRTSASAGPYQEKATSSLISTILGRATAALIRGDIGVSATLTGFLQVNRNGSNQTGASGGAFNKVQFNNEASDAAGWFDNATNYRYTPLRSGWYLVIVAITAAGLTTDNPAAYVYKNGTRIADGIYNNNTTAVGGTVVKSHAVALVYMNGSTDYIEGYAYLPTGITVIDGAAVNTYMHISPIEQDV